MTAKLFQTIAIFSLLAPIAAAQTGGSFAIGKSVIASGGGTAAGGAFTIEGTIGQPAAGIVQGGAFSISGGFVTPSFSPTAATVSISGRVLTPTGRGLINATILLTDSFGNTRTVRSSSFGYYRFDEVAAGQTYVFSVVSKRFQFNPQVVTVTEAIGDLNFNAEK